MIVRLAPLALCLPLIGYFEQGPHGGPALTPYRDSAGYWTTGLGHRCAPDYPPITVDEAYDLARKDLQVAAAFVCQALGPHATNLSDGQFGALCVFTFNEGADRFLHSTLHALVMQGQFSLVPHELEKWVYAHVNGLPVVEQGLVKRRAAEIALWETGVWTPPAA